jgi:phospholipid transport system transporter-binding protein
VADTDGRLSVQENGTLQLAGRFDYDSILSVRAEGEDLIRSLSSRTCRIDLGRVESSDSVFMALLLSWLRLCNARSISLDLVRVPPSLFDMARVSGLDSVLPITGSDEAEEPAVG